MGRKRMATKKVVLRDCKVSFNNDTETRDAVFAKLINWYFKHEQFSGEGIMQCDGPLIDAANILCDIADKIIQFDVKWDE